MDSVTQFTLGAAVVTACLGPKIGPRKAALMGGLLGTLPDLDVLIPFETRVDDFVYHRGWSHAFFVHVLATPVIGEVIRLSFKALKVHRTLVWTAVLLCLVTHAMIDAVNIYGTRIFWPFFPEPVGLGSVFIIDPLFTVPLLIAVIWAFAASQWSARLSKALTISLAFGSFYLVTSVVVQNHIYTRAEVIFASQGVQTEKLVATASPFNIILWRVIGKSEGAYHNLYLSLFDDDAEAVIYTHDYDGALKACVAEDPEYQKLVWFSDGLLRTDLVDGQIVAADIRMGLTPDYVFQFALADYAEGEPQRIEPARIDSVRVRSAEDWDWFATRLLGEPRTRALEQGLVEQNDSDAVQGC